MSYAKRMLQLPTSRRQHLAALALVAAPTNIKRGFGVSPAILPFHGYG